MSFPFANDIPEQAQGKSPGLSAPMTLQPVHILDSYKGSGKLAGKSTLITGGDSGVGRAVALHFACEGAKVAILYLPDEQSDADETVKAIEAEGAEALTIAADQSDRAACDKAIETVVETFGGIDVLVNNAGHMQGFDEFTETTDESWERHFAVNVYGIFYLTRAAIKHMKEGASIINTTSVNAFAGSSTVVAYSATKGAVASFTRAPAKDIVGKGIRVNSVAPGPIWTPIQPQGWPAKTVPHLGDGTPMGRMGQPCELAPAFVYLACQDSSYVTGQTIHVNGGMIVNG